MMSDLKNESAEPRIYLTVADESEEFKNALYYAASKAKAHQAQIGVLHLIEPQEFLHWGSVEDQMRYEHRRAGEEFMAGISQEVYDFNGLRPTLFLEEGDPADVIMDLISKNPGVVSLILGGNSQSSSPGPLVSFFSGKGMAQLCVPLIIVPDNIAQERVIALA